MLVDFGAIGETCLAGLMGVGYFFDERFRVGKILGEFGDSWCSVLVVGRSCLVMIVDEEEF